MHFLNMGLIMLISRFTFSFNVSTQICLMPNLKENLIYRGNQIFLGQDVYFAVIRRLCIVLQMQVVMTGGSGSPVFPEFFSDFITT